MIDSPDAYSLPDFSSTPQTSAPMMNWSGIFVEQHIYQGGEFSSHPLPDSVAVFHMGQTPIPMEQVRAGKQIYSTLHRGQFVLIPTGLENICRHTHVANELFVRIESHKLIRIASEIGLPQVELKNLFEVTDPFLFQMALTLLHETQHPDALGSRLYTESIANSLIVHLLRNYATHQLMRAHPEPNSISVQHALDFIHDQLDQDLSLEQIAASVHLSPYYFSRVFKHATGFSPHQYVIQQRVERAKMLLINPQQTLSGVAAAVGFADQSHLNRHFKRLTGMTPTQYRKIVQP